MLEKNMVLLFHFLYGCYSLLSLKSPHTIFQNSDETPYLCYFLEPKTRIQCLLLSVVVARSFVAGVLCQGRDFWS